MLHDKRRRNPHWNQILHVLLNSRIKNMIHCTAQLCRLGQGDVASLDDDTDEIMFVRRGVSASIWNGHRSRYKWLATETPYVEQMKLEVIFAL